MYKVYFPFIVWGDFKIKLLNIVKMKSIFKQSCCVSPSVCIKYVGHVFGYSYWMSQNLPQICTVSAQVYRKSVLKQMQYRFAVTFGTLSIRLPEKGPGVAVNPSNRIQSISDRIRILDTKHLSSPLLSNLEWLSSPIWSNLFWLSSPL